MEKTNKMEEKWKQCKECGKHYLTHGYKDDLDFCYECHCRKEEVKESSEGKKGLYRITKPYTTSDFKRAFEY